MFCFVVGCGATGEEWREVSEAGREARASWSSRRYLEAEGSEPLVIHLLYIFGLLSDISLEKRLSAISAIKSTREMGRH